MKTSCKIFLILMVIGILYFIFGVKPVEAADMTPKYFGINAIRTLSTPHMGYAIGNPGSNGVTGNAAKLWNILKYSSSTSNDPTEVDVYCVKAGVGFTTGTNKRATYNLSFDMYKDRTAIASQNTTLSGLVNGGHYNELLALANLLYLPETEGEEELTAYLERAGIYEENYTSLLTVDEVKSVQQAAIWYFTNYGEESGKYDKTDDIAWFNYTTDGNTYTALSAYNPTGGDVQSGYGAQRMEQAEILYEYLINKAKANAGNYADSNKSYKTKLTLYASSSNNSEQPLMQIEREKEFDLSLRKYITKVNGTNVSVSRVPQIDVSALNNLTDTTASYKHKKDPVLVAIGDTVTYRIQIYNEGDVDGYVNTIVDQLPTGLTFSKLNTSGYTASYDSSSNRVTITRNEANSDILTAFNGTLDSTILELECTVTAAESNKILTNVAWIAEEETIDGNVITNEVGDDRDSEPSTVPSVNKDNMEDYRGNTSNKTDLTDTTYYYEGQQDDDDFEKLITKQITGSYNVQLEKVDKDNTSTKLSGAVFSVTLPGQSATSKTTGSNGLVDLGTVNITNVNSVDTITVTEVTPPSGYDKIIGTMQLQVRKKLSGSSYVANTVSITSGGVTGATATVEGNTIKIVVPNEKITGSYNVQLEKVDKNNTSTKLEGAVFSVTLPGQSATSKTTGSNGLVDLGTVNITNVNSVDTITVTETKAPEGYNKILDTMQLQVRKKLDGSSYVADTVSITSGGVNGASARVEGNTIKIVVPNEKITGSYNLQLEKVDKDNTNTKLSGAEFSVTLPGQGATNKTTGSNGIVDLGTVNITNVSSVDTITVTEVTPPSGYNKILDTMQLQVRKKLDGNSYVADTVSITSGGVDGASARVEGNTIKIVVPNEKITGSYNLQLEKVDKDNTNTKLSGAEFSVTLPGQGATNKTTGSNGIVDLGTVNITNVSSVDTITVTEVTPPSGYNKILDTMQLQVSKKLESGRYVASTVSITSGKVDGLTATVDGNTIKIVVPNEKITGNYSLQLVKVDNGNADTKLEGAVFKITLPDGSNTTETTDENGIINVGPVDITQVGTEKITIEEVTAPSGYNKLFNSFEINVTKGISNGRYVATGASLGNTSQSGLGEGQITTNCSNSVITITVPNERITGSYSLQLEKVDSEDNSLKLEGAEFKVTLANGSEQTVVTDGSGKIGIGTIDITQTGTDTITIEEIKAPNGYHELTENIVIEVEKEVSNGKYIVSNASITSGQGFTTMNYKENSIELTVKNDEIKYFDLSLRKFIIAVSDDENIEDGEYLRNEGGTYTREPVVDTSLLNTIGQDGQVITTATYNHTKEPVTVRVNDYVIYMIRVYNEGNTNGYVTEIKDHLPPYLEYVNNAYNSQYGWSVSSDGRTVTTSYLEGSLIKEAEKTDGKYTLSYVEVPIMCKVTNNAPLGENITNIADITDYTVDSEEPLEDRDSQEDNVELPEDSELPGYKDEETGDYIPGQQDDDDFEKVIVEEFDLSLRKFIVAVSNDETVEDEEYLRNEDGSYSREPVVDTSLLETVDGNGNRITTAIYNHTKEPVEVRPSDYVVYMIRVYNEGNINGYVTEIKDHLPPYLEYVDNAYNNQYGWELSEDGRTVTTKYLEGSLIKGAQKTDGGYNLSYVEVPIMCKVVEDAPIEENITNIADITEDKDENGDEVEDRDSEEDNVELPEDSELPGYKDEETGDYIPGQQDDDDFEKVVIKEFDLSLRKFIVAVSNDETIEDEEYLKNEDGTYTREPVVDTSLLNTIDENGNKITTAIYNHTKEPVEVRPNDYVVYMLRVYNEGEVDGYAAEIKDHLPPYLEFVDNEFNQNYGWQLSEDGRTITTNYLGSHDENNLIDGVTQNEDGSYELSYKEVPIMCKVTDDVPTHENVTNIADITKYQDEDGDDAEDRDSKEDNVDLPEDSELPGYKDDEEGDYIPGQEDDDDFEKVVVKEFDLALRKFITQVEDEEITNRIPNLSYDETTGEITYNHTKDPVQLVSGNVVIYTIRVYNEGEIAGYASEITDDIPDGLEFLPDNETNINYRWVMYDENGNVTENVEEAVSVKTDYLSKDNEETEGENLLDVFNPDEPISDTNPDYKDVQIAFRVIEPNESDRILVNSAQISEDTDEDGDEVEDKDSTPDEWNDGEDDQDKEYVELLYFDLSLRKWVTQAIVIDKDGNQEITETGHEPYDDPEQIVKVDLYRKNINDVTVKFRYKIRVTNEGEIAGYAKEITDYVPEGLRFLPEDNPGWTDEGNNVISTRLLENTLLQPGEYAEVEVVLTWINSEDNMGLKENTAEISEDYNDYDVPDRDSTPDNQEKGEDDIDDAPVMLSVSTGQVRIYFTLGFVVLITIASGLILIKKFVL